MKLVKSGQSWIHLVDHAASESLDSGRVVGQPEVIQAASNRLNWRKIAKALIDGGWVITPVFDN